VCYHDDMHALFITGTDTGVGKTHAACLIARQAAASGLRVGAYKPVCSGA
jgi:dethiobiotin synthetase